MTPVDLAIIGGGPAGTAAAFEARTRGLRVAVWERERFPRDKVCGEFVSAESLPLLERQIPEAVANAAIIHRGEFVSPSGQVYAFRLPRPGRGLSRLVMDEALWRSAARLGAEMIEGTAVSRVRRLPDASGWELEHNEQMTTQARALLVACGRWWRLDGLHSPVRQGIRSDYGPWLGIKAHFRGVAARDAVEMYFFPGGYCGLAPVEGGLYNACCLVHRSLARAIRLAEGNSCADLAAWLRATARHPALDARLRGADQTSSTLATAPLRPARGRAEQNGAFLAGDAAGFLDPFTGDGISMALHAGRLAARVVTDAFSATRAGAALGPAARHYRRLLSRAARRSYTVAGLIRTLVRAPAEVQELAAKTVPWLGARLLHATRWRECGSDGYAERRPGYHSMSAPLLSGERACPERSEGTHLYQPPERSQPPCHSEEPEATKNLASPLPAERDSSLRSE